MIISFLALTKPSLDLDLSSLPEPLPWLIVFPKTCVFFHPIEVYIFPLWLTATKRDLAREERKEMVDTTVSNGHGARNVPRDGDYIQWDSLPPGGALNRWSHSMTKGHDYVGAQVSPDTLHTPLPQGPRHVIC